MKTKNLLEKIRLFSNLDIPDDEIRNKFFGNKKEGKYKKGDTRGWKLPKAKTAIKNFNHIAYIKTISYRPFDNRYIYYTPTMVDWGREAIARHDNLWLVTVLRQLQSKPVSYYFVSDKIISNGFIRSDSVSIDSIFPLYIYNDDDDLLMSKKND